MQMNRAKISSVDLINKGEVLGTKTYDNVNNVNDNNNNNADERGKDLLCWSDYQVEVFGIQWIAHNTIDNINHNNDNNNNVYDLIIKKKINQDEKHSS